jgi:hypothetical protein
MQKLLGLYAFMARDGIPIPSKSNDPARVDFFSPILADIGDSQSVDGDLSTFSGHLLVCREVLNNASKDALVLMDELVSEKTVLDYSNAYVHPPFIIFAHFFRALGLTRTRVLLSRVLYWRRCWIGAAGWRLPLTIWS